jgi:hypothetical protein
MKNMRYATRQPWISFILGAIVCHATGVDFTGSIQTSADGDLASRSAGISSSDAPVESQCIRNDGHQLSPALNLKFRSSLSGGDSMTLRVDYAPRSAEAYLSVRPFVPCSTLATQNVRLQI